MYSACSAQYMHGFHHALEYLSIRSLLCAGPFLMCCGCKCSSTPDNCYSHSYDHNHDYNHSPYSLKVLHCRSLLNSEHSPDALDPHADAIAVAELHGAHNVAHNSSACGNAVPINSKPVTSTYQQLLLSVPFSTVQTLNAFNSCFFACAQDLLRWSQDLHGEPLDRDSLRRLLHIRCRSMTSTSWVALSWNALAW